MSTPAHELLSPYPWHQTYWDDWIAQRITTPGQVTGHHAQLLIAPEDTGAERLLHSMAAAALCEDPQPAACGLCASCRLIMAHNHPDLRVLRPSLLDVAHPIESMRPDKPSKDILVAQVRDLADMVNQTSLRGGVRVILVYPAGQMNESAANALLKTLEEPPRNTLFLLTTHDVRQLMPTILSRCQQLPQPTTQDPSAAAALLAPLLPANMSAAQRLSILASESGAWVRIIALAHTDYFAIQDEWLTALLAGKELAVLRTAAQFDKHLKAFDKLRSEGELGQVRGLDMRCLVTWTQRFAHDLLLMLHDATPPRYYPQHAASFQTLKQQLTDPAATRLRLHELHNHLQQEAAIAEHPLNARANLEHLLLMVAQVFA